MHGEGRQEEGGERNARVNGGKIMDERRGGGRRGRLQQVGPLIATIGPRG